MPPGFGFARGGLASFALFPHTPKPTPDLAGLRLEPSTILYSLIARSHPTLCALRHTYHSTTYIS
jgi:hypothetical protein